MNILTNRETGLYSVPAPVKATGGGNSSPVNHDAQPRLYAVFLCVLHGNIVLMGYVGTPKGVPVRDTGLLPCIVRHHCLAGSDDGFKPLYHESTVMQNTTQVASATSVSIPDYRQVRDALRQLLVHLNQHQPSSQVKPAIAVLDATERMMRILWTMVDESSFRISMLQYAVQKSLTLNENNVQTINNITSILSRGNMRLELHSLH